MNSVLVPRGSTTSPRWAGLGNGGEQASDEVVVAGALH